MPSRDPLREPLEQPRTHGQRRGAAIAPAVAMMRALPWHGSLTPAARLHAKIKTGNSSAAPGKGRREHKKLASP